MEQTSTITEPIEMMLSMDPRAGDKPRNADRVVCKVVVASGNGCSVEGRYLLSGENFLVIYADRFDEVIKLVRTEKQLAALAAAEMMALADIDEWIEEKLGKELTEVQKIPLREDLKRMCPISPYQHTYLKRAGKLHGVDLKSGLPPLASAEIVAEWTRPETPETSTQNAIERMANAFASAIDRRAPQEETAPKAKAKTEAKQQG